MPRLPTEVRTIINRVMESSPGDLRLVAQRLHDHAVEERMPAEDVKQCLTQLGYTDIEAFCKDLDMPAHVAERWRRFGVSAEMRQVFTLMIRQRRKFVDAIEEFEAITNSGLTDFLRDRGVL